MKTELEHILTSGYKDDMILFMSTHPECFDEAVQLAITDKQPYSWRSAWLLFDCMEHNDTRIQKQLTKIIDVIPLRKDGHQRSLLKLLFKMDLNDEQEGALFDVCVSIWETLGKSPSVRYTAFEFIVKTAKKYPDLINELTFLSQNHYLDSLSPGIKNSIMRTIKALSIKR